MTRSAPKDLIVHHSKTVTGRYTFTLEGTPQTPEEWNFMIFALSLQAELYREYAKIDQRETSQ